ncbi:MAG: DUF1330 domain-containing protein [Gammaproteobacteria bacterium]|nr:DUF1330 domain-containing protein [Gammaproteobacteria bacterium]
MSAYIICDVQVKDRDYLQQYLDLSVHTLKPYGGQFLAQAGDLEIIEGDWKPGVLVIAEFPSMGKARAWYESVEYSKALKVKPLALSRNMILVDGVHRHQPP